ncbi:MAG TPA: hypothetical protein VK348_06350 [Planctomycetota bacterium]|nr:hypothetical protein [Planctomycetota bacterium]
MHLLRAGAERTAHDRPGVAQLLQSHERRLFVVWTLPANADAAQLGLQRDPESAVLRGHRLAATNFSELLPPGIQVQVKDGGELKWVPMSAAGWPSAGDVVDGVLNLGADAATVDAEPMLYRSDPPSWPNCAGGRRSCRRSTASTSCRTSRHCSPRRSRTTPDPLASEPWPQAAWYTIRTQRPHYSWVSYCAGCRLAAPSHY